MSKTNFGYIQKSSAFKAILWQQEENAAEQAKSITKLSGIAHHPEYLEPFGWVCRQSDSILRFDAEGGLLIDPSDRLAFERFRKESADELGLLKELYGEGDTLEKISQSWVSILGKKHPLATPSTGLEAALLTVYALESPDAKPLEGSIRDIFEHLFCTVAPAHQVADVSRRLQTWWQRHTETQS